ncbi:MAG: carbonic anhydrase [Desulfarculus sp.]|jgi:carbonic anhydrase|nr:MAG: carbonic anhydrase [Desulfarculus sp.]
MALKTPSILLTAILLSWASLAPDWAVADSQARKPSPSQVLQMLSEGNARFVAGKPLRPHQDLPRLRRAGRENQAGYAFATVLTCSDSRVPVEIIFDAGVMDLFVVRVAGNVVKTDEAGSIEYGLAHVKTPLLVVLGHTGCGAVEAVADQLQGHGHPLERNIPPLVAPIIPAVRAALAAHPQARGKEILPYAVEQNVWQSVEDLFLQSPAARQLVESGAVKAVGAIYDVGQGRVRWLPEAEVVRLLKKAAQDPRRAKEAMAPGK